MPSQLDLDQGGTFRQFQRVWQGPSVGWVIYPFSAVLEIKTGGTFAISRGTTLIKLNVNASVTLNLPSSKATVLGPAEPCPTNGSSRQLPSSTKAASQTPAQQ